MSKIIGIIGAMDIEVDSLVSSMTKKKATEISGIKFYQGKLCGKDVVVAKCGIGKVFASICAQTMILKFNPTVIINTGVAGTLDKDLHVLDIAIAGGVVQHDMDTSALGDPVGLISGINIIEFKSNESVVKTLKFACESVKSFSKVGIIATGDKFIHEAQNKTWLKEHFNAIACEMEGGAIGHTCYVNNVPFGIIRAISDGEGATMDYLTFSKQSAQKSIEIVKKFVELY
ncbi:MAG: 5'-methylthioadenosine/adenosylhomocysteine nucleosidase [Clostridia bacterium]|nr:5'-methylthioadenosine/adenosylhomocysteine nucleosidase [Clostridia bacterium]